MLNRPGFVRAAPTLPGTTQVRLPPAPPPCCDKISGEGLSPPLESTAPHGADITPRQNCHRSTQLLGGESRFVLSTSGHIAALVNPPGSPKATHQTSKTNPASPAGWLKTAQSEQGSWWPDMLAWLGDRRGADKPAQQNPAAAGYGRSPQRPAPTSWTTDKGRGMYTGIGRSLSTSYFRIADQLTGEELSYLRRTRDLVDGELLDSEVVPVINGYWERAEFPWPLIKKLAKLRIVGDGIDRYGCLPMSPIAAGLVNMELNLALETLGAPGRRRVGDRRASQGITGGEGTAD